MTARVTETRGAAYTPVLNGRSREPRLEQAAAPDTTGIPAIVLALGVLLIVALRLLALDGYPASADEGGWPLSVRKLALHGERTFDYFKAPGFHWQLRAPFELFGATIGVARAAASVAGLVGLFFFHRIARQLLPGARQPLMATLLLGTSYAAVMTDRRALIEPFLVAWMLALAFFALRRARHDAWWIALCTAGVLLTKASGIFLLPVLGLVALVGDGSALGDREGRAGTWRVITGIAAGVALAGGVFLALYLSDPVTFLDGWMPTLLTASTSLAPVPEASVPHLGRFGIDPRKVMTWIDGLARDEPLLFALGLLGMVRAFVERRQRTMALWLVGGMAFLVTQTHVLENHLAVLYAPLALLSAWMLAELHRAAEVHRLGRWSLRWTHVAGAMIVLFGLSRVGGAIAFKSDPSRAPMAWLTERAGPDDHVVGAPYLVMRVPGRITEFARLPLPFVPTPAALDGVGADWIVVDDREWRGVAGTLGVRAATFDSALAACCDVAHRAPAATIYRVRARTR